MTSKKVAPSRKRILVYNATKQYCRIYQDEAISRIIYLSLATYTIIDTWNKFQLKSVRAKEEESRLSRCVTMLQSLIRRRMSITMIAKQRGALQKISSLVQRRKFRKALYKKQSDMENQLQKREGYAARKIQKIYRRSSQRMPLKRLLQCREYSYMNNIKNLNENAAVIQHFFRSVQQERIMTRILACVVILQRWLRNQLSKKHNAASIITLFFQKVRGNYTDCLKNQYLEPQLLGNYVQKYSYEKREEEKLLAYAHRHEIKYVINEEPNIGKRSYFFVNGSFDVNPEPEILKDYSNELYQQILNAIDDIPLKCKKATLIQRAFRRSKMRPVVPILRKFFSLVLLFVRKNMYGKRRQKAALSLQCFVRYYQAQMKVMSLLELVQTLTFLSFPCFKTDLMRINFILTRLQKLHRGILDIERKVCKHK